MWTAKLLNQVIANFLFFNMIDCIYFYFSLTHVVLDQLAAILQTTFLNAFSWKTIWHFADGLIDNKSAFR